MSVNPTAEAWSEYRREPRSQTIGLTNNVAEKDSDAVVVLSFHLLASLEGLGHVFGKHVFQQLVTT
jgi:hypothetical protein